MKFYIQNYQKKKQNKLRYYYNSTDHNYEYNKTKGGD